MQEETSYGIIPFSLQNGEWKVFLILHKEGNHWGFPKGHKKEGESSEQAASRELYEETGLRIEKFLLKESLSEQYVFLRSGERILKRVFYFPAVVNTAFLLQKEEILKGVWMPFSRAMETLTFPEGRALFKEVLHELRPLLFPKA
ncbi:MAG: hypothetical protein A2Y28_03445 [Chlamydiae bacterium GWC2_50_10]|nr:MAG: hypothetical protein A2Z85_04485 [Chlamydiae bacterium GWA2_50_15]OGN53899.1 MAG: hypothetical protein A2Y28_03445 [Chlamydiae bacterium GWC2_50_10]OGN55962.1 MAG: hypothetical protein A2098_03440 [Chlamydiae bacterium GWF2_49_8]OGN57163.1 MAG: hypothetical protein A3D18_02590 [Chlamydiae bacterium RIFCSPHIGHO2_02_FULL_49_29]OGN62659.1 MAG: hypothetical protein A3E26_04150 [Chlamydiae bacterium RIFCSPHIGHO2_12_FULL_49_32]HAZ15583.1 hypothetical protein [Parachlamydiales bacterium]